MIAQLPFDEKDRWEAVHRYEILDADPEQSLDDITLLTSHMDDAAAIRALTKINSAIKIIAASGLHANADVTKASGAGIKHFLTKPYTDGTLLKPLRTILEET